MASVTANHSSGLPEPADIELIFLGTGTSSSVPQIECLTALPNDPPCHTCLAAIKPGGKKNIRRNTSAVLRLKGPTGEPITVIIDVGKNFQAAAIEWFPKYGLRNIDAVLITHAHADAMNGLDDLRAWTLNSRIQPHIDIYVSQATFMEVERAFPYLVSKEFASGGGDVPEFRWHIIEDQQPFEIADTGVQITPFSVHHGRLFSATILPGFLPTPAATTPSTPTKNTTRTVTLPQSIATPLNGLPTVVGPSPNGSPKIRPYLCFGFAIQGLVYLSDASHIPEPTWAFLEAISPKAIFVLDCLRFKPHTSHFGIAQSIHVARRYGAARTYLTGFSHDVAHEEYVHIGEALQTDRKDAVVDGFNDLEREGLALVAEGKPLWIRPAHDGMKVFVGEHGNVWDETY